MVTIRFNARVAAWWQNFKYYCYLNNFPLLNDCNELKREMTTEFLPLNYRRKFQYLMQGLRSVEDYILEFYKLEACNQLNETEDQRVAWFLTSLRISIQDALIVHSFNNVSKAQSNAKAIEEQQSRSQNFNPRNNHLQGQTQPEPNYIEIKHKSFILPKLYTSPPSNYK